MSNQETKDKMLKLYRDTLSTNKALIAKLTATQQDLVKCKAMNLQLRKDVVKTLEENVLIKENIKTLKGLLKKVQTINEQ